MAERWQPPPKQENDDAGYSVDDRLLERVLTVNPHLRRDTLRVPRPGEALPAPSASTDDLANIINYFALNKAKDLLTNLADFDARQAQLLAERQELLRRTRDEFATFLSLLDREALERSGPALLAKHQRFLEGLGVTVTDMLSQVRRSK